MYKVAAILYFVCFFCYILFSRVPDYFDGDFAKGVVTKATFSVKDAHPVLDVEYIVGSEKLSYTTNAWSLSSYKKGQVVTIIYSPLNPGIASIYSVFEYWIKWNELLLTATLFIILFITAVIITGKNNRLDVVAKKENKKRKYDD